MAITQVPWASLHLINNIPMLQSTMLGLYWMPQVPAYSSCKAIRLAILKPAEWSPIVSNMSNAACQVVVSHHIWIEQSKIFLLHRVNTVFKLQCCHQSGTWAHELISWGPMHLLYKNYRSKANDVHCGWRIDSCRICWDIKISGNKMFSSPWISMNMCAR